LDHRTTFRLLGIVIISSLVLGIVLFQAIGGKSFVETLFEIFILIIGGLGLLAIQFIIWPERFLPKSAQITNTAMTTRPIEDFRPLAEGEIFQSRLQPKQKFFHRGDPVLFWARFKGKLIDGYLGTYIKKPDGTFDGVYDLSTVKNSLSGKGKLNGEKVEAEGRWSWIIPTDCKLGAWSFFIHAANHFPPESLWVRTKAFGLHVLSPSRTDLAKGRNVAIVGDWWTIEVVE
jgi:hypothetical protein